jgi:hypothetical protein
MTGSYGNSLQFWRYLQSGGGGMVMTMGDNGYVGIGTNNPGLKLHIQSPADHKIRLQHQGSADHTDLIKRPNGTFAIYNGTNSTAWKGPLSMNKSGFVGIGTEGPSQKLHVEGNTYTNGWLHATKGARISGTSKPHSGADLWVDGHTDTNTLNVRTSFSANALTGNTVKANHYLKVPRNWEGGGDVCNASNVGAMRVKWIAANVNGVLVDNVLQVCLKKNARNDYYWYTVQIYW